MAKKKPRPGPVPETLKIDGNWRDAVGVAMKKKPAAGWPKLPTPKKK